MTEQRRTTVKTEYEDGKKIVTTISVVITEDDRIDGRCTLRSSTMGAKLSRIRELLSSWRTSILNQTATTQSINRRSYPLELGDIPSLQQRFKASSASTKPTKVIQKAVLERHNYYRAKHGLAPLRWNFEVA